VLARPARCSPEMLSTCNVHMQCSTLINLPGRHPSPPPVFPSCPSHNTPADFPPTLFVSMVKDPKQSAKIGTDWSILTEEGSPVGIIRVSCIILCLLAVGNAAVLVSLERSILDEEVSPVGITRG